MSLLKLPPVSHTFHASWEQCPRKAWHVHIARDRRSHDTRALAWGITVHDALERFLAEGMPLPDGMRHYEHLYTFPVGYEVKAELKLGIKEDGEPCDFFDDDVWARGKADCVLSTEPVPDMAILIDHKTGKKREDPHELEMHAVLLHANFPQWTNIKGWYNWLQNCEMGRVHDLSGVEAELRDMRWTRKKIEDAFALGYEAFPPVQSGLCPWCPVKDCQFHPGGIIS